jgi:hypothetical protein
VRLRNYRLYRLDGAGKIIAADWLEAESDEDALREAAERTPSRTFELWERERLVARVRGGKNGD